MTDATSGQNAAFGTNAAGITPVGLLDVEHFITLDRQSIRLQFALGIILLSVGTLGIFGAFAHLADPDPGVDLGIGAANSAGNGFANFDTISKCVGLVINLAGLFPFNNCWSRWERIRTLRAIQHNPSILDTSVRNDLIRKLYAKFLGVS
ncbi:MAG TPA: hypothetical protein VN229_05415 [Terriglobales bacterium]|nr:hypothetical protein [Terriglobales bacterium]